MLDYKRITWKIIMRDYTPIESIKMNKTIDGYLIFFNLYSLMI